MYPSHVRTFAGSGVAPDDFTNHPPDWFAYSNPTIEGVDVCRHIPLNRIFGEIDRFRPVPPFPRVILFLVNSSRSNSSASFRFHDVSRWTACHRTRGVFWPMSNSLSIVGPSDGASMHRPSPTGAC